MEVEGVSRNMLVGESSPNRVPYNSGDVCSHMTPTVVPTTIVREVLTESNYEYWRTCVKSYLKGQDLWEVCKMTCDDDKARDSVWQKKNFMALHAIQVSCSREMLSLIRGIKRASYAWDLLREIAHPTLGFEELSLDVSAERSPGASTGNDYFSQYESFAQALDRGSWNDIELFIYSNPHALRAKISATGLTPLHFAARAGHVQVMKRLVDMLNPEDLELREGQQGYTPLALVASGGITEMAQSMIRKNSTLANILDWDGILPVVLACNGGKREMTRFLYSHTRLEELAAQNGKNGATLLSYCIASEFLDIALDILQKHPSLAVTLGMDGLMPLYVLGQMPSLFRVGCQLWFWQRWIYSCITVEVDHAVHGVQVNVVDDATHSRDRSNIEKVLGLLHGVVSYPLKLLGIKNIHDKKLRHAQVIKLLRIICTELEIMKVDSRVLRFQVHQAVSEAVKHGNVEFVIGMIKSVPELLWNTDTNGRNIFCIAILNRQEKIFSLLRGINDVDKKQLTSCVDKFGNNMLHLVALLAPSDRLDCISGAAPQMQR